MTSIDSNSSKDKDLEAYIFEIQRMSTEDGPGIRTTVFFKQCPLRCVWCHNPESIDKKPSIEWYHAKCIGCLTCVDVCPEKAITFDEEGLHIDRSKCKACGTCVDNCPSTALRKLGDFWTLDTLVAEVEKDRAYYSKSGGGVTASGGEAALQTEFLTKFLRSLKEIGLQTALDTCGHLSKEKYKPLLPYVDLYLYDLKEIDPEKHKSFTGVSNERILENLIWLVDEAPKNNPNVKFWIRTPVIPCFTATDENIKGIGTFIIENLKNKVERWDLLSYNNLAKDKYQRMDLKYECNDLDLMTEDEIEKFVAIAKATGVNNVHWDGLTKQEE